jgi:hypothetical protein
MRSTNESCSALAVTASSSSVTLSLVPISCLNQMEAICQFDSKKPAFRAFANFTLDSGSLCGQCVRNMLGKNGNFDF